MTLARILIVEDDAVLAAHLEETLNQLGFEVAGLVATGEQAIAQAIAQKPDAILMDIRLRGEMNGIQAAKQIHKAADIPIVFLTAYTNGFLQEAKETDAYAYLTKPVREHELRASLEMALYKHRSEKRIRHLSQVLRAIRNVNQLIIREHDSRDLMNDVCDTLLQAREYKFVWLGLLDTDRLKPVASAGEGSKLIDLIVKTASTEQTQKLPGVQAFRTLQPVVCYDMLHDERYLPWKSEIEKVQFSTTIAVPMVHDEQIFGVLSVYSDQANVFDEEEVELLKELADDMAFGLKTIELDTARRQGEERIRYQAELLENVSDAIVSTDIQFKVVSINKAGQKAYGWKADELIGMDWGGLTDSQFTGTTRAEVRAILFERGEWTGEVNQRCKDGRRIVVDRKVSLIYDKENKPIGVVSINRDITERKKSEAALRESEERYRNLVELSPDGIAVHQNGRLVFLNSAGAKTLGVKNPEEVLGQPILERIHPDNRAATLERVKRLINGEAGIYPVEDRYLKLDGTEIPVEVMATVILFKGEPAVQLVIRDITERKHAEQRIAEQLQRLKAMHTVDRAIASNFDLRVTLNTLLEQLKAQLKVDAASICMYDKYMLALQHVTSVGFYAATPRGATSKVMEGIAGQAVLERHAVHIPNLAEVELKHANASRYKSEQFVSYHALPLISKGQVKGVIEVFHRTPFHADSEWLDFLDAMAEQAAIAIDISKLFSDLQRSNIELTLAYEATIEGWSRAMDLRDKETEGHSLRVTEITMQLADRLGISKEEQIKIRRGALLHDIGKLGVPDSILLKPGKLTDDEMQTMKGHPALAYQMLLPIEHLRPSLDIPYCHHEKWDGSGYPRGLKGEQIPLDARIFAVVDVWDALMSERVYRAAWPEQRVLDYLREQAGKHFDPHIVDVFLKMITSQ